MFAKSDLHLGRQGREYYHPPRPPASRGGASRNRAPVPIRIAPRRSLLVDGQATGIDSADVAARLGAAEAEVLDLRLKLEESLDREGLLRERALQAEEKLEDALRNEHDLRGQIDRLAEFHRAVERSLPWRLIQFLRGLAGRRW